MNAVLYTLVSVVVVSLASFVGVVVISLKEEKLKRMLVFLIPLAIGALLGDAFFHLIPEAFEGAENGALVSTIIILGIIGFFMLEKYLRWHHHHPVEDATHSAGEGGEATHLGALVLTSDGLHNFIDGIIIGASYLVSIEIGIATTIAVILHEIPQEIGDFGVLIYAGYTRGKALFYNFLSALMAILGAAFVFAFSAISEWLAEAALPFAAGAFIYIAAADLVPELHRSERGKTFFIETVGMVLGLVAMYLLLFLE